MPYLKPATLAEAIALAQDLRPEDDAEIRAMTSPPTNSSYYGHRQDF